MRNAHWVLLQVGCGDFRRNFLKNMISIIKLLLPVRVNFKKSLYMRKLFVLDMCLFFLKKMS